MDVRWTSCTTPVFMSLDLPSPLAVVCHDAGATNLILPWLKDWHGLVRPVMAGPARLIWEKSFPAHPLPDDPGLALQDAQALLSGTGWASSIEHDARIEAARRGIFSVAVLDHWVNYAPRFVRDGLCQLPDEVWVTDDEAAAIARRTFVGLTVRCQPNLYVQEQLARIGPPPGLRKVLYVLEPVRDDWGRGVPGEFQALDYAIERLTRLGAGDAPQLILRPHPSESEEKYRDYARRYSFISFDRSADLAAAISDVDVVIGVESFALTVALQAGRPVFSTLPPWAPEIRLPHPSIIQIRKLPSQ